MPTRIGVLKRVVLHIAIAIEGLGVGWPHGAAHLLTLLSVELEPEAHPVLAISFAEKAELVEINGQRARRDAIHTSTGVARHHRIGADKPPDRGVVIAGIIEQQPTSRLCVRTV